MDANGEFVPKGVRIGVGFEGIKPKITHDSQDDFLQ